MKHVISVTSLEFHGTRQFLKTLQLPSGCSEVEFDFSGLGTVEPFGMLVASRAISMLRADNQTVAFRGTNFEDQANCSYAANFGFFKNFGMNFGRAPSDGQGNQNYIPIQSQGIDELRDESTDRGMPIENSLIDQANQLAQVLARSKTGSLFTVLSYSIREILRNVVDHSKAKSYEYCAQYWPSKSRVEIAILDRGVGVRKGLAGHPDLGNLTSDREALHWAILPGISGKTFRGVYIDPNNPYQNSGYGLFITSQLCKKYGSFLLGSYDSVLRLYGDKKADQAFGLRGTAVRLVLNTQNLPTDVEAEVNQIIQEGEKIIESLPSAVKVPNSASKLLRGSFSIGTE